MKYEFLWRNKWITFDAETIDDFIKTYEQLAQMFKDWKAKGVELDKESGVSDDYATFYTENEDVAKEYGFEEPWEEEEEGCGCCCACCEEECDEEEKKEN